MANGAFGRVRRYCRKRRVANAPLRDKSLPSDWLGRGVAVIVALVRRDSFTTVVANRSANTAAPTRRRQLAAVRVAILHDFVGFFTAFT